VVTSQYHDTYADFLILSRSQGMHGRLGHISKKKQEAASESTTRSYIKKCNFLWLVVPKGHARMLTSVCSSDAMFSY
jgi:hypothetical protein